MAGLSTRNDPDRKDVHALSIPQEIADSLCSCGGIEGIAKNIPDDDDIDRMRDWYQACADTARIKILFLLKDRPLCVCVIKEIVGIGDSRLSYHLNILKKAGMIGGEQQGNYIIYQITPAARSFIEREYQWFMQDI